MSGYPARRIERREAKRLINPRLPTPCASEASYVVTTDGREHRGVGLNGAVTVATMHWEQAVLVVHHRISDPKAGQLINKVRYELIGEGQTLRATEDFDGGGRSHHNVWIFRRR